MSNESGGWLAAGESPSSTDEHSLSGEWVAPSPTSDSDSSDSNPEDAGGVTSNWWKGIVIALVAMPVLAVTFFVTAGIAVEHPHPIALGLMGISAVLLVSLRVVFPTLIFLDARRLRSAPATDGPRIIPYIFGALFAPPPLEIVTIVIYLVRRRTHARVAADGC